MNKICKTLTTAVTLSFIYVGTSSAALVTGDTIWGSGNINGSFTVDQNNDAGIELGLRGKLRHNAAGAPENTFNETFPGSGIYQFDAGVAPTQSFPTSVWSFEWSINSNFNGNGSFLDQFIYELALDSDPSQATDFFAFDPIHTLNPTTDGHWDHSMGDNSTVAGAGVEANNLADYQANLSQYNLAQNSWKAHWYFPDFDPTVDATYDIKLSAYSVNGELLADTSIQIQVGKGGAAEVPEPTSIATFLFGLFSLVAYRRRVKK